MNWYQNNKVIQQDSLESEENIYLCLHYYRPIDLWVDC